ncbi:hypothetical protein BDR04DRAFT_1122960 [Suillus decipiens]|nr:hypothetical protein BDR04DRAFT_1122960 [Suillus decipiens]
MTQPQPKTNTTQPISSTPPPRVRRVAVMMVTRQLNQTGPKRATKKMKMKRVHRHNNLVNMWSKIDDTWYEAHERDMWRAADEKEKEERQLKNIEERQLRFLKAVF